MLLGLHDERPRIVLDGARSSHSQARSPSRGPSPLYSAIPPTVTASLVRSRPRQPLSWLAGTTPFVFSVSYAASAASMAYCSGAHPVLWSQFCDGRDREGGMRGTLVRVAYRVAVLRRGGRVNRVDGETSDTD